MAWVPQAGDNIEVRAYCWHAGSSQIGINTLRYRIAIVVPGVAPLESRDLCAAISDKLAPKYKALLDSSATYLGISMQIWPSRAVVADWSKEGAGAGLVVGNDCPTQASGLISLRTNVAGPKGRGRIYPPFPSVTSNGADALPVADYVTALNELSDLVVGPENVLAGPDLISVTYYGFIAPNVPEPVKKDVTRAFGVRKWATQRRRGSFGRRNEIPSELTP